MLYLPEVAETVTLMDRARQAWPHMAVAINNAQEIVLTRSFHSQADHFAVYSQTEVGKTYQVYTMPGYRSCNCESFKHGGYRASGRKFCKHLIATEAYLEILRTHLRLRLVGNSNDRATRQKLTAHPQTYLMHISNTQTVTNIAQNSIFFFVRWGGKRQKLTFVRHSDAIVFAQWLAFAHELPPTGGGRYDEEIAKQQAAAEWKINLTPEQLQRWYATGSVV